MGLARPGVVGKPVKEAEDWYLIGTNAAARAGGHLTQK